MIKKNEEVIPAEVCWVWGVQYSRQFVGLAVYEQIQEIIGRYPKYFPWEHKYNSIPQEVHDAYRREQNPYWDKPLGEPQGDGSHKGLIPSIIEQAAVSKEPEPPNNEKSFVEQMQEIFDYEDEQRKRQHVKAKADKALWDKHYKKYKLEYRP